jgi:cytochrome c oxidase subunit II
VSLQGIFSDVFRLEVTIAAVVFAIILVLLVVSLIRRRAGVTRRPSGRADNMPLEIGYAVALTGIAVFLVVVTANANHRESQIQEAARTAPDVARVDVTAYQWCWRFRHLDGPATADGTCTEDPSTRPVLVVPVGRPVELRLTSNDVVHAFWIPDLAVKSDVYPDHTNSLSMTFDHPGQWLGRCSEYCGTHHPTMDFYVRAVPEQQYQQYLASGGAAA